MTLSEFSNKIVERIIELQEPYHSKHRQWGGVHKYSIRALLDLYSRVGAGTYSKHTSQDDIQ